MARMCVHRGAHQGANGEEEEEHPARRLLARALALEFLPAGSVPTRQVVLRTCARKRRLGNSMARHALLAVSWVALAACARGLQLGTSPRSPLGSTAFHGVVAARSAVSGPALSRRSFSQAISLAVSLSVAPLPLPARAETTQSGLAYKVIKAGKGPNPVVGELAVLRWKAEANNVVFDDLYAKTDGYYYHRVGSGNLVPGVEEAVLLMRPGDVWELSIPGPLGFGPKGKKASPGQPSIPPNATLKYTLELVALPGRDEDLLEVTGGEPGVSAD